MINERVNELVMIKDAAEAAGLTLSEVLPAIQKQQAQQEMLNDDY